jgi:hypothetical protein
LHFYRSRWGKAYFDPRSLKLEAKIKSTKRLATPTISFHGEKDGVTPPSGSEEMGKKFKEFRRFVLEGVGHFVPREACSCCSRADSALFSVVSFTDATIWEMERCRLLSLRVILLLRGNSIAFGSKRTSSLIL